MSPSATAFDDPGVGVCLADLRGRVCHVNRRLAELLGWAAARVPAPDVADIVATACGVDAATASAAVAQVVTGAAEQVTVGGDRSTDLDGNAVANVSLVRDGAGAPFLLLAEFRAQPRVDSRPSSAGGGRPPVRHAAHDPLTGLPNRAMLMERLSAALARATRASSTVAVMFIDLDDFKDVNDSHGHHMGDEVLVETGRRLLAVVRPFDTVTRLGGDEFVVVCSDLASQADAMGIANRVLASVSKPMVVDDREVLVTSSIGIAISGSATTAEAMLHEADSAMYRAKARGKNQVEIFDDALRTTVSHRAAVESLLRRALHDNLFRVYYQPIYELATGELVGIESLLRLDDPEQGLLSPARFIEVAELSGLIVPIGAWVLRESCRQLAEWRACGHVAGSVRVAVNLSARQVSRSDLLKTVCRSLDDAGIEPTALSLELTESIFMDADAAHVRQLEELRSMGVTIEIDDFGTGYSSLGYLKRLPVGVVKVDQSFVAGMVNSPADYGIVSSVIGLGQALGLTTIAEGVETAEQLDALWVLGCDQAQGYHLGRPSPPANPPLALTDWGEPTLDSGRTHAEL